MPGGAAQLGGQLSGAGAGWPGLGRCVMNKPSLVVIGNGMAGMRTVEELLELDRDMYRITVFGAEPHGNYNRILLSPVLAGEKTVDEIMLHRREWYAANRVSLHAGD